MNFLRKIINDATITAFKKHITGIQAEENEIFTRAAKILDIENKAVHAAQTRYLASYSDTDLEAWVQARMRSVACFEINQTISNCSRNFTEDRIDGLLLRTAISSAKFGLESKRADIVKDDSDRSADVGVKVESTEALAEIDRRLEACEYAISQISQGSKQGAVGYLGTALNEVPPLR